MPGDVARRGLAIALLAPALLLDGCDTFSSSADDPTDAGTPPADATATTDAGGLGDATSTADADADAGGSAYAAAVLEDAPILYFRLDEKSGVQARDSSKSNKPGAYFAVVYDVPGALASDQTNTAVRFDGDVQHYLNVTRSWDFDGQKQFTIEVWIRPENVIDGAFNYVFGRGDLGWALYMQSEDLKFQRKGGVDYEGVFRKSAIPHDLFSHVVGTYDGVKMHLYVDGVQLGESPGPTFNVDPNTDEVHVGQHFPGTLDEVAIYDHALTAERVLEHHRIGTGQ